MGAMWVARPDRRSGGAAALSKPPPTQARVLPIDDMTPGNREVVRHFIRKRAEKERRGVAYRRGKGLVV